MANPGCQWHSCGRTSVEELPVGLAGEHGCGAFLNYCLMYEGEAQLTMVKTMPRQWDLGCVRKPAGGQRFSALRQALPAFGFCMGFPQ